MDLDKCVKQILIKHPFYGLFLLNLNRKFSNEVLTTGVGRNGINTELVINKEFWNSLQDDEQIAIILHELGHILFKHILMGKEFPDKERADYAMDMEVNSYIPDLQKPPYVFPQLCGFELKKGTKWYYDNLPSAFNDNGFSNQEDNSNNRFQESSSENLSNDSGNESQKSSNENGDYNPNESHSRWGEFEGLSDTEKELISKQIDYQTKNTVEQLSKMRGTVPSQFKSYIEELFKQKPPVFNWKAYFRRMLGSMIDISLKKSRKKESLRFPDATGIKHKRKSKILVAVDTSGSISDKDLCDFFSEINYVYKAGTEVTILEFDAAIQRIYPYYGKFDGTISGRGGTGFNPPWEYYKSNIKDFNTLIIFTDGYAPTDQLSPLMNTVWVITSNGNRDNSYIGKTIFIPNN